MFLGDKRPTSASLLALQQPVDFLACRLAQDFLTRSSFVNRNCTGGTARFTKLDLVKKDR